MNKQQLLLMSFLFLIVLAIMIYRPVESPVQQSDYTGFLVFTDIVESGPTIDIVDLEHHTRSSLFPEPLNPFTRVSRIDDERVFVSGCFGWNNPLFCSAYVQDIVSPEMLERYNIVAEVWQDPYGMPVWSPDGEHIAFIVQLREDSTSPFLWDAHVMNADGTGLVDLAPDQENNGPLMAWSPDSQRIVFTCNDDRYLCFSNSDGSDLQRVPISESGYVRDLVWSPDGEQVAFSMLASDFQTAEIFLLNADGTDLQPLIASDEGSYAYPSWSPDGSKILMYSTDQQRDVYVLDLDDMSLENVSAHVAGSASHAVWSPDSTAIAFFSRQTRSAFLYTVRTDGSSVRQIASNSLFFVLDGPMPVLFWLPVTD